MDQELIGARAGLGNACTDVEGGEVWQDVSSAPRVLRRRLGHRAPLGPHKAVLRVPSRRNRTAATALQMVPVSQRNVKKNVDLVRGAGGSAQVCWAGPEEGRPLLSFRHNLPCMLHAIACSTPSAPSPAFTSSRARFILFTLLPHLPGPTPGCGSGLELAAPGAGGGAVGDDHG